MGTIKSRLDEVLKKLKLLNEINQDQAELIEVLQEKNEHLEALNKQLEAENAHLRRKPKDEQNGPK